MVSRQYRSEGAQLEAELRRLQKQLNSEHLRPPERVRLSNKLISTSAAIRKSKQEAELAAKKAAEADKQLQKQRSAKADRKRKDNLRETRKGFGR